MGTATTGTFPGTFPSQAEEPHKPFKHLISTWHLSNATSSELGRAWFCSRACRRQCSHISTAPGLQVKMQRAGMERDERPIAAGCRIVPGGKREENQGWSLLNVLLSYFSRREILSLWMSIPAEAGQGTVGVAVLLTLGKHRCRHRIC